MHADPNFWHHLEGPRGCFQNLKKKIWNFFKILDFGPENAKMWPLFKSKNGPLRNRLTPENGAHRKALELGFHPESTASGPPPSQPSYWTFKVWVKFAPFPFSENEKKIFFEKSFPCKIQFRRGSLKWKNPVGPLKKPVFSVFVTLTQIQQNYHISHIFLYGNFDVLCCIWDRVQKR